MAEDMFTGLGSQNPGGGDRLPFLDGLGTYEIELLKFRAFKSEKNTTAGHNMFTLEVVVRNVLVTVDEASATAFHAECKPSHEVGFAGVCVWNVTKTPFKMQEIAGVVHGLVPHISDVLAPAEMTKLGEIEGAPLDEGGGEAGVIEQVARYAASGDGTRFAGKRLAVTVSAIAGKPFANKHFTTVENARRRANLAS